MANLPFYRLSALSLIVAVLFLLNVQLSLAAKNCFNVDGDQTNSLPCNPDSNEDGPCCNMGDICLSTGLCRPGPGVVNHGFVDQYRSDCTDQTWTTSNCFSGCNNFTGNGLESCGNNKYCCYDMNGCDCSSTSLFDLGPATFVTTLPTVLPTSATPVSTSASTTGITAASQAPSTTSATPTATATQTEAAKDSNNVAIGAGVGVGIGVPLLAAVGFLGWWLTRRNRKNEAPPPYAGQFAGNEMKAAELATHEPIHEAGAYQPVPHASERYAHQAVPQSPQEIDGTQMKFQRA